MNLQTIESNGISVFLTAYDPSDLPGGSLDPLGFERGYLHLADKILPGLTNVANRPRYYSILCLGAHLANVNHQASTKNQYQARLECILRLERFWALANVLACKALGRSELSDSGIRGVTYAREEAAVIEKSGLRRTNAGYHMLSRQVPYGVIGIYGAVAEGMRFLDRKTFLLTPDLGEKLAEGFLDQTHMPSALLKAIREGGDVSIATLTDWGERAHINGDLLPIENECFAEARDRDSARARMTAQMRETPRLDDSESELQWMSRLLPSLKDVKSNQDLAEAVETILAYENCYRLVMLAFERLLYLCRSLPAASISSSDVASDAVLARVCSELPGAALNLKQSLESAETEQFLQNADRIKDLSVCIERLAASCNSSDTLAAEVMRRHEDVQRGKLDRGRRKMPWLETTNSRIALTMTRVGGMDKEVTDPLEIYPHPYRLASAEALNVQAGCV